MMFTVPSTGCHFGGRSLSFSVKVIATSVSAASFTPSLACTLTYLVTPDCAMKVTFSLSCYDPGHV